MAKFTNVHPRFNALYFLNDKASASVLDSVIKFSKDLAIPFCRSCSSGNKIDSCL